MTDEKTPVEQALDLLVYAPFGLFITVTEELPKLVEKGRQRLTSQLTMARMMGEMAAPQLQSEAEKAVRGLIERMTPPPPGRAGGRTAGAPGTPPARGAAAPAPAAPAAPVTGAAPAAAPTSAPPAARPRVGASAPREAGPSGTGAAGAGDATHLAIPGYDSLSAMQVVQRLAGLEASELEAVRAYEAAHRGRKTIISRAEQLLAEPGA